MDYFFVYCFTRFRALRLAKKISTNKEDIVKDEAEGQDVLIRLDHIQQRFDWDCGIACIHMILSPLNRKHLVDNFNEICFEEGFNSSTWTIDLCYILNRYNVQYEYYTTTLGIHPDLINYSFYDKILQKDGQRVTQRFAEAATKGMPVRESSLTGEELRLHISKNGPIILLTNACLLKCQICQNDCFWIGSLRSYLPWKSNSQDSSSGYHGHYIVLCGFNENKQVYYYRNPCLKNELCTLSYSSIDQARKCPGTDQDTILIFFRRGN